MKSMIAGLPRYPLKTSLWGLLAICLVGCGPVIESAAPRPTSIRSAFIQSLPQIMRGTVASEAYLLGYAAPNSVGYRPLVVQGYGLVVGLNGTGSNDVPPDIRAHMLAEMKRHGIGSENAGLGHISPQRMLDSKNTAVVVVQGIIPPGATKSARFDLRVMPVPNTSTTSLESGRLYTMELAPHLLVGRRVRAASPLALANGPIFINPFAEPGAIEQDGVDRRVGRILNGGAVIADMPLKMRLVSPSHVRAGLIVVAINTRFPIEMGQLNPTARGESDESIELTVPPSYRNRIDDFIELLLHTTIRQANPKSVAMSIKRLLESNPTPRMAIDAAWRWQALGTQALPILRGLYDSPEHLPRTSAILAGAHLDDPLCISPLISLTESGGTLERLRAINLLAEMRLNPLIDQTLRSLLNDPDPNIRIETYEALAGRNDPSLDHIPVDGKFMVDIVPSDFPMIYVTHFGLPRIVVFGRNLSIELPLTMRTWSNRLMIKGNHGDREVEVYYRPVGAEQGFITKVSPQISDLIHFLGHTSTVDRPSPGLGLSYSETVGAIHQICRQQYVKADFKAQQDRIRATIDALKEKAGSRERPEFSQPPLPEGGIDEKSRPSASAAGGLGQSLPPGQTFP